MATFTKACDGKHGNGYTQNLIVNYSAPDIPNNRTWVWITYSRTSADTSKYYNYGWDNPCSISIDGGVVASATPKSNHDDEVTQTLCYWEGWIGHNPDGSRGINVSASFTSNSSNLPSGSISGYVELPKIPREANITSFSVSKLSGIDGLTKVKFNYSADATLDWAWYSTDNGASWHNLPSGSIVSGLEAGKGYDFKLRVRRADSQLLSYSNTVYQTTHDINKITGDYSTVSNGEQLKVTASNPSGARCDIKIHIPNADVETAIIHENTIDTTFTVDEINSFLQYITGGLSFPLRISALTVDNNGNVLYTSSKDVDYRIVNSDPTFNDFVFQDINAKTYALTGNRQDCILNYSYIKATVPVANKAIAKNHATMSKYRYTITADQTKDFEYSPSSIVEMLITDSVGNKVGAKSGTFTVYAIDSRGASTPVVKLANNVIAYTDLIKTNNGTANRVDTNGNTNGVSERTQISFAGTMWKGNFGAKQNSIINTSYRYRNSETNTWTTGTTKIVPTVDASGKFSFKGNIKGDTDLGFDISNVYIIEITIEDELSKVVYTMNLGSGKPNMALHKKGVAVMQKYDTDLGGALQVDGDVVTTGKVISLGGSGDVVGDTLPIGSQIPFAGGTVPDNWLLCDGSAISRTEYAELFAIIGTSYGAGNGSTTFNLPDKRGRVSVGYNSSDGSFNSLGKKGGSKDLQSHNHYWEAYTGVTGGHNHGFERPQWYSGDGSGDNYAIFGQTKTTTKAYWMDTSWNGDHQHFVSGTTASSGAGNSGNLQPYEVDNWIIKAFQSAGIVADVTQSVNQSKTSVPSNYAINQLLEDLEIGLENIYSSTERVIGKWFDKPLYRKTITINNKYIENGTQIPHNIQNLEFAKYELSFNNDNNEFMTGLTIYSDGSILSAKINKTNIVFVGNDVWNASATRTWYVTIEYTKTTD